MFYCAGTRACSCSIPFRTTTIDLTDMTGCRFAGPRRGDFVGGSETAPLGWRLAADANRHETDRTDDGDHPHRTESSIRNARPKPRTRHKLLQRKYTHQRLRMT